jgi:hypothetical protein
VRSSDVAIYWGELGIDVSQGEWSGHFSSKLNDAEVDVLMHEAWARYQPEGESWFFKAGRMIVPFGNNPYYFPTYPAVNDLGYSTLQALGAGFENDSSAFSLYAFNPRVEIEDSDDTISDWTAVWTLTQRAADECRDGWKLTAGYSSNLTAHDLQMGGDTVSRRVAAANLFARYDFHAGDAIWHMLADYTWALDGFDPADLDANGDSVGDMPSALNAELVYEPRPDELWGVSYQVTGEMADYASTRWGLLHGQRLSPLAMLKLEYTHGEYDEYATAGQNSEDTLVAELNLRF